MDALATSRIDWVDAGDRVSAHAISGVYRSGRLDNLLVAPPVCALSCDTSISSSEPLLSDCEEEGESTPPPEIGFSAPGRFAHRRVR